MKRRKFIRTAGASLIGLPLAVNGMDVMMAPHVPADLVDSLNNDNVLVLVNLAGGNDGLNTVLPVDQYGSLSAHRGDILIPSNRGLSLTNETALHPAMTGMHQMFQEGQLNIIQGVGYPNFNRSHFRATDILESGSVAQVELSSGWLGRMLQGDFSDYPNGYPNVLNPDPFAITIGKTVSKTCQGTSTNFSLAIENPSNLNPLNSGLGGSAPPGYYGDRLSHVRTTLNQTNEYGQAIQDAADDGTNAVSYPGSKLAGQLRTVAQLISGGLQTKIYVVKQGGYDTHGSQTDAGSPTTGRHANLLSELSDAIAAFQDDLDAQGLDQRVIGLVYTEFGRRIINNGSRGTDHGDAGPMFLFGSPVVPGIMGSNPTIPSSVSSSQGVSLQYDFKDVYQTVLDNWLCAGAFSIQNSILYGSYTNLGNTAGPCALFLPIELLSFDAQAFENHIGVMWEIGEADKLKGFWIQRSADGIAFEDYHWVEGYNNVKVYEYKDRNVRRNHTYYYRLKQVETDENTSFSLIRSAMIREGRPEWLKVYPNPTSRQLQIETDQQYYDSKLVICDRSGRPVLERTWNGGLISIPVAHLPQGMYIAHMYTPRRTMTKQFLKINE